VPVELECASPGAWALVDASAERRALPTRVELPAGDHVIRVEGDGLAPEWRIVNVAPPATRVHLQLAAASPAQAVEQWAARYGAQASPIDATASVELLSRALSARRLVAFTTEGVLPTLRLRAVMVSEGRIAGRAERVLERAAELPGRAQSLLQELLEASGQVPRVPPLYKRPAFWLAVGGAAVVAAGAALLIALYPRRVELTF
jgi:hypothetical protein